MKLVGHNATGPVFYVFYIGLVPSGISIKRDFICNKKITITVKFIVNIGTRYDLMPHGIEKYFGAFRISNLISQSIASRAIDLFSNFCLKE